MVFPHLRPSIQPASTSLTTSEAFARIWLAGVGALPGLGHHRGRSLSFALADAECRYIRTSRRTEADRGR
jgi:hypothetical protein